MSLHLAVLTYDSPSLDNFVVLNLDDSIFFYTEYDLIIMRF